MKVDNYDETVDEFKFEDFDSYRSTDSLNLEDKKKRLCIDEDAEWKKSLEDKKNKMKKVTEDVHVEKPLAGRMSKMS